MDVHLERRIRKAARRLMEHGAKEVYVFGSVLTGPLREDSDVDLAIRGLPAAVFFRAMAQAARIVGRPIDLVDLDRADEVAESLRRSGQLMRVEDD